MAIGKQKKNTGKLEKTRPAVLNLSSGGNSFIIKHPWISEKSHRIMPEGKYVFLVDRKANKSEIAKAVELIYKVSVISVNTINIKGKPARFGKNTGRNPDYKKAIVMLKKGQKIDVMPT